MGSTSNLDNYQMKFEIWNTSGINVNGTLYTNGHTLPSWDDLRFTYTNNTLMDYWIESTNATAAIVWVEVPCIPVAGTPMYIYYGNTGASAASNGTNTFPEFFDDFSSGTLDTSTNWKSPTSHSISGGVLQLNPTSTGAGALYSKSTHNFETYILRGRHKSSIITTSYSITFGFNTAQNYNNNNYVGSFAWESSDAKLFTMQISVAMGTTAIPDISNGADYYVSEIRKSGSTVYLTSVDSSGVSGSTSRNSYTDTTALNYIECEAGSGLTQYYDWVLMRKYAATEPYHLSQEIELLQTTGSPAPTAAFSANVTSGSTPLVVSFTDSSTGTPTAWWWDVDGDNTTDYFTQNCTHTYSVGGTYTVNLTTSNAYGTDSEIKIDYITASTGIIANFTGTPTSGIVPFTVQFNDTSTGGTATTWNWSFGDGALFNTTDPTLSNATHDYLTPGIYSVNLSINDTTSSDYEFKSTYITAENIRVNFTYNVSVGIPPFVVQFNITDPYGTIDNWSWDVQNDGFADYFTPNCTHTYDAVGLFSVNLSINNTATQNFTLHENIIQSGNVPIVNFTASTTDGAAPLVVTFTDNTSGNATAWAWDLTGDGVIDNTTQNASYRYTTSGYYTIRHRANNTFGLAWENKTDYIFVGAPPVANFANHTSTLRNTSPGSSVIFNYTGNGTEPLSFEWDVNGDGSIDYTTRNVSHTYATQGTYSVNMRSYSAYGSDWENKTGYILVGTAPTGAFTSNVTSGVVSFAVNFINQTTGYPTPSYAWDIDNSGSTDYTTASPNHTYTAVKNYSVKLTITNTFGSNTTTITDYIVAGTTPISNFTVSARNGTLPFTVNFYANMTGWPNASYSWDLTGDGVTDATGRNTTHTYTTAGLYTINLTTTNMFGTNVTSRTDYIAAGMEPKTKFSAHPLTGTNILTTTFTDLTGGSPTIWNWSFGDGEYNETQNPVHYYGTVGDFNVSLNATNAYGYNSTTYYYYIVVSGEPISTVIFTYPATNVTSSSVSMCGGIVANYTDDVWFEYGLTPSALTFSTRETRNLSGESNFTSNMSGSTLYGGSTYYYRAASEDYGKGVVRSFTVPTPSPDIADETVPQAFETELDRFERFDDADFDFMAMAPIVAEVYTSVWGFWIYGLIWAGVFGAFFLRHEDITIPTFLYVLFSFTISSYLPASWMPFIYVSVAVCLAAIVYTLYRGVRNG